MLQFTVVALRPDSWVVPNLNFYAADDDWFAILEAVFDLSLFRVFESYSEPDCKLREFQAAKDLSDGPSGRMLALYAVGSGPEPLAHRIDLLPGALGDATFRYRCEGWGLIQLYHGGMVGTQELRWSHTNHNTEKRALKWADTTAELGEVARWNWAAVTSASARLNRVVRRMAVTKISSRPVLPHAAQLITSAGLRHDYGTGIHATPSYGMTA